MGARCAEHVHKKILTCSVKSGIEITGYE
jgi:hypothetical protein